MTTQDLRPDAAERLQRLLGFDREVIDNFLAENADRREEIARSVRRDEKANAEFYRMLGDR